MFKRFFSRKRQKSGLVAQASWHLKKFVRQKARILARLLQARSQKMSPRELKWWLAGFCGLGVLASTLLLFYTLTAPSSAAPTFTPGKHRTAKSSIPQTKVTRNLKSHQRIIRAEQYLDSLQKAEHPDKAIDDFLKQHPGLLDSIRLYKSLYELK